MIFLNPIPKNLTFGKDISKITFNSTSVIKKFKKKIAYIQTEEFLNKMENEPHYPKIISKDLKTRTITMTHCGNLLSLYNLPNNWKKQFYTIRDTFIKYNYYILDLRFLPYTPYVINNICTKNNKIYIVDVTMFRKRSQYYIHYKINFLIFKITVYLYFINNYLVLYILHILFELYRLIEDFLEIILYSDISFTDELKNIIGYFKF